MKIFKDKLRLKKELLGKKDLSFVPTMGGFHNGHKYLIQKSKKIGKKTIVSIYVNPKQFNSKKDYFSYPRVIKHDLNILKKLSIDYVYLPNFKDVYNFKTTNKVYLDKFSKELCGKNRKGHFEGVLNVVNRLLEIIKPKYIILGLKDYQQMSLIKQHIIKRKIETILIECKIIRNNNGVAYSTRNKNINKNQFKIASRVYHYLKYKKKKIKSKIIYFDTLIYKKELMNLGVEKIDYLELYNIKTLKKPKRAKEKFNLFIAYYLNKVRLIDNI
jgi:pantoate--beta-alanine ligase